MSMIKGFCFLLLCSFINFEAQSQNAKESLSVGIDLFRSLPTYFQSGYTLEPSLIYKTKYDFLIDLAVGYSSISKDAIFQNIQYTNEGSYAKLGGRKIFAKNFSVGLSVGYTSFTEKGVITYKGNFFPDVILNKSQANAFIFIEPTIAYEIAISSKFYLITQFRTSFGLSKINQPAFPAYSAPGFGPLITSSDSGKNPTAVGFSVRLVYKIFNKE
jgi:Domain of unknown function (DUF6048)